MELPAAEIKKHVERIVKTSKSGGVMLRSPAEVFGTERVKKSHSDLRDRCSQIEVPHIVPLAIKPLDQEQHLAA
jgi:hypothetical protein